MSDIFQEVEEELRHENYAKLWQRYGKHAVAAAVLLVAVVAGYQIWRYYDDQGRLDQSNRFAAAMDLAAEGQSEAASAKLAEISDPSAKGYGMLAAFAEARLLAEGGETAAAVAIWDRIAANSGAGETFQAIATLLAVMYQLDSADPAELESRLAPLLEDGHGYRASALELSALLALRRDDKDRAREQLQELSQDVFAPGGVRLRAEQLLSLLEN